MHPDVLLAQLTSAQWVEWQAYARLEPFGFDLANLMQARLIQATANFSPISAKHDYATKDFMLRRERLKPPTLANKIRAALGAPGSRDEDL